MSKLFLTWFTNGDPRDFVRILRGLDFQLGHILKFQGISRGFFYGTEGAWQEQVLCKLQCDRLPRWYCDILFGVRRKHICFLAGIVFKLHVKKINRLFQRCLATFR